MKFGAGIISNKIIDFFKVNAKINADNDYKFLDRIFFKMPFKTMLSTFCKLTITQLTNEKEKGFKLMELGTSLLQICVVHH